MDLSRRSLLAGVAASAAIAVLPGIPGMAALGVPVETPSIPLKAFVVGTPGEYDWQSFFARSAEEAFEAWCSERREDQALSFDASYVRRVAAWDGRDLDTITPADWIAVGMGHCCERCGYETHSDCGCRVVAGEVVCDECLTTVDRVISDPDDFVDDLVNRLVDEDEAKVRAWLEVEGCWDVVKDDLWPRALAEVSKVSA